MSSTRRNRTFLRNSIFFLGFLMLLLCFCDVGGVMAVSASADVSISAPTHDAYISGNTTITGNAYIEFGFRKYELYYAPKETPGNETLIYSSNFGVINNVLGTWNTSQVSDGRYFISLKLYDTNNNVQKTSVEVTVDNINNPPVITTGNQIAVIGKLLEFKVEAYDIDNPETPWGQLTYSAENLPLNARFDDLYTQIFSWVSSEQDKGIYNVTFRVRDGEFTAEKVVTIFTLYIEENRIITPDYAAPYPDPKIYKDKIVWEDRRSRNYDIYMYDLSTSQERQITTNTARQERPAIYEDKIVWQDYRNGNYDIYMYDLSTGQEAQITTNSATQWDPAIYEDKIVWQDYRNRNSDIYMYDLSTSQERQITTNTARQERPAIYEDKIVWQDDRNSGIYHDLYMYDLEKELEIQISDPSSNGKTPDIYGNKIVWYSYPPEYSYHVRMYISQFYYPPQITSITPARASANQTITITGADFGYEKEADFKVLFSNNVEAQIQSWSNTEIVCTVPEGAVSGPLTVVTKGGRSNAIDITIRVPPMLLAYYPFEGNANDVSGNNFHGTPLGGPQVTTGIKGSAYEFDGVNDYIRIVPVPVELERGNEITISAWIKTTDNTSSNMGIMKRGEWRGAWNKQEYALRVLKGNIEFNMGNGATASKPGGGYISNGKWHMVTGTLKDGAMRIYVDGVPKGQPVQMTLTGTPQPQAQLIGALTGGNYFKGTIDEVKIWNYALSGADIQYEHAKTEYEYVTGKQTTPNLVQNPKMEQGTTKPNGWYTYLNDLTDQTGWATDESYSSTHSLKIVNAVLTPLTPEKDRPGWRASNYINIPNGYPGNTFTFGGLSKALNVEAGAFYALDFWVHFEDGTSEWYYSGLRFSTGTHDWEHVSAKRTFSKRVVKIMPYLLLYNKTGTVWFDDVYVYMNPNLVLNSKMEAGGTKPDYWKTYQNSLTDQTGWATDASYSSTHSLKVVNTTGVAAGWKALDYININNGYPGNTFTFGGLSKALNVEAGAFYALDFKVIFNDNTNQWVCPQELRFSTGTHDWEHRYLTQKFDKPVKQIVTYLLLYNKKGTVWFDDIYVYMGE
jgi:beta propeller repeat protein